MKKSLIALAVLAASGAASAQSSVTLFGIVDAAYGSVKANGTTVNGMSNSGINSSRLGVKGTEDLGGGLSAGFHLEGALNNDKGEGASGVGSTAGAGATQGLDFRRRSTVSVMGNFGEVRLGRDYTPTFWNLTVYDPFGTNGVAQSRTPAMIAAVNGFLPAASAKLAGNNANAVRANNSIGYFLPGNLGGINGQVMYAKGEGIGNSGGDYFGFRLGYTQGPISAHVSSGKTKGAISAASGPTPAFTAAENEVKYTNFAGSYNFGMATAMVVIADEKNGNGDKLKGTTLGVVAPVGAGEIHAALDTYKLDGTPAKANQLGLGYIHNLSKRTAAYVQYASINNKGGAALSVSNNGLSAGNAAPSGKSTGYEIGVRHSF